MSQQPYYARRNDDGEYTWAGVKYKSVTTYLGYSTGQYLLSWYSKQAALKAASHLYHAGIIEPGFDAALDAFCAALTPREITRSQAVVEIGNWQTVMREPERYRDFKARIGSLTHHLIYEHAMGQVIPTDEAGLRDYLHQSAIRLNLWDRAADPEFRPTEDMVDAVVASAYAYALSALEWIDKAKPKWQAIGNEAVVIHKDHGDGVKYAGTVDAHMILTQKDYGYEWHKDWPKGEMTLWADFKTSNSLAVASVQAQVEAYAHCDCIGFVATGEEHPLPEAEMIGALHVGPHGTAIGVQDEFGTLESKAKQVGSKLYTWPRNEKTFEAFVGLVKWADYCESVPQAHQQRKEKKEPVEKRGKYEPRECPI